MSRKAKEEYNRFFSVTEHRSHEKGHTEYKVTARFVSKRRPEDVKEVTVWRRYSELKKLHGELSYTHRNLFRRQEEFPPFPRAQIFGRFEAGVIEERRRAAEAMLVFAANIPALYNSPQLKDFFRGGEVRRPLDPPPPPTCTLPPPLIPLPEGPAEGGGDDEAGQPQDEAGGRGATPGEPEAACEAFSDLEGSPPPCAEREDRHGNGAPNSANIYRDQGSAESYQRGDREGCESRTQADVGAEPSEFDLLFDSMGEDQSEQAPAPKCPLTHTDLALFDPCARKEEQSDPGSSHSPSHAELLAFPLAAQDPSPPSADGPPAIGGPPEGVAEAARGPLGLEEGAGKGGGGGVAREPADYLAQAAAHLRLAVEREEAGDYGAAVQQYEAGVDILLKGAQGDPDAPRREAARRKMAQYLQHAEDLLALQPPRSPPPTSTG
ncbi:sorting nexin-15 isoform X2 [Lepisosteus oculatus]|uniref:sorting nexin-15 isoform X2 n=1 Tax=Lepisosteus oculatus TaxID=7918 RepID=UPI0035F523E9